MSIYIGTNKDYIYSKKVGFFILKNKNTKTKDYQHYNQNLGVVSGLGDHSPIKVSTRQLVGFIVLYFSGKYNPITETSELRKALNLTPDVFLYIRGHLEELCKKRNLLSFLEKNRKAAGSNKKYNVVMKGGKLNV